MSNLSRVLPNKRHEHYEEPLVIFHKSSVIYKTDEGVERVERVKCSTLNLNREKAPTPKQRAKATKAMMEARRSVK